VAAIGNDRTRGGGKAVAEAGVSSPSNPHHCHFLQLFHDMSMKCNAFRPSTAMRRCYLDHERVGIAPRFAF
jgi:hypothetical protein